MNPLDPSLTLYGVSAGLLYKLLGPTADYLGGELKDLTEKRLQNVNRIFEIALAKIDPDAEGAVSPRVLDPIVNEGSYCDDEVVAEYMGGVLAASRTREAKDDRGVYYVNIITGLSTYQLRAHYFFYSTFHNLYTSEDHEIEWTDDSAIQRTAIVIPPQNYMPIFGEDPGPISELYHAFGGLNNEGLLGGFGYGEKEHLESYIASYNADVDMPDFGLFCRPSLFGIELFLWGHGISKQPTIFPEVELEDILDVKLEGSLMLAPPTR